MEGGQSHVGYHENEVVADGVVTHSSQNRCIAKKPTILMRMHLHTSIFSDHVEIGESYTVLVRNLEESHQKSKDSTFFSRRVTFLSILGCKTLEGNSSRSKKETKKAKVAILELIETHLQEDAPQPFISIQKIWLNLEE
jgi:hypothetical protein